MSRPVVAAIAGYTKRNELLERSFAPLRNLRRKGVIDRIVYVTWDKADIDPCLTPLRNMPDVELVRVPEPQVSGRSYQKKHFYQTENLRAMLACIDDGNALVLKTRPDVVVDEPFLAQKILAFDQTCGFPDYDRQLGVAMPPSPFQAKIWTPWAEANQPFFMEDGLYLGLRDDIAKLVSPESDRLVQQYGDEHSKWIVHVARFIVPFLPDYPLYGNYLRHFHLFVQDVGFRLTMLKAIANDPFWWFLVITHAWILANNFHIDCGYAGQIRFFPTKDEAKTAAQPLDAISSRPPYNSVEAWRGGQNPGSILQCIMRAFGLLMDDTWQRAIFERSAIADLPHEQLIMVLENFRQFGATSLMPFEGDFYRHMAELREEFLANEAEKTETAA
jgi:hypothetical protein